MFSEIPLINKAAEFAKKAHTGQKRKWMPDVNFIMHPIQVAQRTRKIFQDYYPWQDNTNAVCAAFLHDCVEEGKTTITILEKEFNLEISEYVSWLTNPPKVSGQSREYRKKQDCTRLSQAPRNVRIIKLIDRNHNLTEAIYAPTKFKLKYVKESVELSNALNLKELSIHQELLDNAELLLASC